MYTWFRERIDMPRFKLVIDAVYVPRLHKKEFGPFESLWDAMRKLKKRGWMSPRECNRKGVWFTRISRFTGVDGHLVTCRKVTKKMRLPKRLPKGYPGFWEEGVGIV